MNELTTAQKLRALDNSPWNMPHCALRLQAADELEVLQKEVDSWKNRFLDEAEIVNAIWTALHIKSFEEAKGKTIVEHVDSLRTQNQELEKDNARYASTFRHYHVNNGHNQDDSCAKCGLDLRDEVHFVNAKKGEK